jgi:MFS family permease
MAADKAAGPGRGGQPRLPRIAWLLAGGSFVNCLGNFVVPFLVPYLLHRGYGASVAAGAVSAYAAGKIAAGLAGGVLTDRFGARVTTAGSMTGSAAATLALAVVSGTALILATAALTGLVTELYRPATSAILAAGVPGRQRVRAFGVYQFGVSAGTAAGTAIGGLAAEHSFLILFAGDAATSLAWAIGAWRLLPRTRTAVAPAPARPQPRSSGPGIWRDRQLARLLAVTLLANLILFQAQTTLPLWVHRQGLPTSTYGLLLALNSALLMVGQLPATRLTARWRPQPVIAVTSVVIGAGFGLLILARTSMLLALAVTTFSLGELAQWPVAAAYTTSLARPGMAGRYAGTRSLSYGTALLLAPLAGTALYSLSPALLWAACAAAGICAAVIITPRHRLRRPAAATRPAPARRARTTGSPGGCPDQPPPQQPADMARERARHPSGIAAR